MNETYMQSFCHFDYEGHALGSTQCAVCSSSRSSAGPAKHNISLHRPSSKPAAITVSQLDSEAGITYDIPPAQDLKDIRCCTQFVNAWLSVCHLTQGKH